MKAIVMGGSGLVGTHLLENLVKDHDFSQVISIGRRPLTQFRSHPTFKEIFWDFKQPAQLQSALAPLGFSAGDKAFCTLGTTIKRAGNREEFFRVDHDYVLQFAKVMHELRVGHFLLVTALAANPKSSIFYNQVKGQIEQDIRAIAFEKITFLRPSLLLGDRKEVRFAERLATDFVPFYQPLLVGPLKKYQPIEAKQVAKAMVHAAKNSTGLQVIENQDLFKS